MTEQSGLLNPGNFCFILASLQCLKFSESIRKGLFNEYETRKDNISIDLIKNIDKDEFKRKQEYYKKKILYFNFKRIILYLIKNVEDVIDPSDFLKSGKSLSNDMNRDELFSGTQNCAAEFLEFLLDNLHESKKTEINYSYKYNDVSQCQNEREVILFNNNKSIRLLNNNKNSWLTKEFSFSLCNKTSCNKCKYYTVNYEPQFILMLAIPDIEEDINLYDCLDHFSKKEILNGDESWKCDKCDNRVNNNRELKLMNTPNTLIIQIKRFNYNYMTNYSSKNTKNIEYPNILNLSNYKLIKEEHNNKYELFAVISHVGQLNGGHYYSICKNGEKSYLCNDERVNELNKFENDSNAYILFYKSID